MAARADIQTGGPTVVDPNSDEIKNLARFAVQEYNKKESAALEFVKVVSAKKQVVQGFLYYITLEATDDGKKKVFETKVWVKIMNQPTEVLEFKLVGDAPSASST